MTATFSSPPPTHAGSVYQGSNAEPITFRAPEYEDLGNINTLIATAIGKWRLTDRVKRLSLPLYHYGAQDLEHLQITVADTGEAAVVGIAAIEAADESECPRGYNAALLHGIYVDPLCHRKGIGSRLLKHMQTLASSRNFDGLLVKANPDAASFFEAQAFKKLPIEDPSRDYPLRYWKAF